MTFAKLPIVIQVLIVGALMMLVPATHAELQDNHHTARSFLYSSILILILCTFVGIATHARRVRNMVRNQLLSALAAFTLAPVFFALPLYESIGNTTFLNAYVDMVSAATTTGAEIFDPARLSGSEHLWRGLVAWMGGFFLWCTATAIFAPLNLGGYEVAMRSKGGLAVPDTSASASRRLHAAAVRLLPVYVGLTGALWLALVVTGQTPLPAALRAMATLSTSGIDGAPGIEGARVAEFVIFVFFLFALSRATFSNGVMGEDRSKLAQDPELRLAAILMIAIPIFLLVRHFLGAITVDEAGSFSSALQAFWGGLFTTASFLTTTGFVSADWEAARSWSGLEAPGLLLMGIALIGGGVATTAGGVKLLRVYALLKHGEREVSRLVHPSSVGGSGGLGRRVRREGAFIAWVFFMVLALALAFLMAALGAFGVDFERALILTIASLANVGPLAQSAGLEPVTYGSLPDAAKMILAAAMVMGRLEILAFIALLNPDFWRT